MSREGDDEYRSELSEKKTYEVELPDAAFPPHQPGAETVEGVVSARAPCAATVKSRKLPCEYPVEICGKKGTVAECDVACVGEF